MFDSAENREQQIRKHHQKWKKWKLQLKSKELENKNQSSEKQLNIQVVGRPEDNARQYARKLIQKLEEEPGQKQCPISKNVSDQLQTNTCTICLELMAPPSNPYILFPCGHNICKVCLFVDGETVREKYTLKVLKCPLCRVLISNYAQNRNLMKLICSYLNNKKLIEKQQQKQVKQKADSANITKLTKHCNLLEKERKSWNDQIQSLKKEKKVMQQVIDRLLEERRRCRKQLDVLEQEGRLINKHMNEKEEELYTLQSRISSLEERNKTVEQTLAPLKIQKNKLQMQEAQRIISER